MYELETVNHVPSNLKAKVLLLLMESWRINKTSMLEIEKEANLSTSNIRRRNTYKANRCRKKAFTTVLKEISTIEVAEKY